MEDEIEHKKKDETEYEMEKNKVRSMTFFLIILIQIAKQKFLKKLSGVRKVVKAQVPINIPRFDTRLFKESMETDTGYLTVDCQRTLSKPTVERTESEIEIALDELRDIEFFKRFPHELQIELFMAMNYLLVTDGCPILKEGHQPCCMYIIISGIVNIFKQRDKKESKYEKLANAYELSHGSYFGYDDLIHERPRTISASCKIVCQLLELQKIDFNRLIRSYIIKDEILINKSLRSLKTLSYFEWEEHEYEQLKIEVKLQKYSPNTLIFEGTTNICPYHVQFIIYGECVVEQEIEFVLENQIGFTRLRPVSLKTDIRKIDLPKTGVRKSDVQKADIRKIDSRKINVSKLDEQKADIRKIDSRKINVSKIYGQKSNIRRPNIRKTEGSLKKQKTCLEIGILRRNHYFGMGENMQDKFIKSQTVVEILMVPRHILIKKNIKIFDTLKTQFENSFPTVQEILDNYLKIKQWHRYKHKAVQQVMGSKNEIFETKQQFIKYF